MAKAYRYLPQLSSFELPFEQIPMCGVTISGAVQVTYEDTGKWWIDDAWLFTFHDIPRRVDLGDKVELRRAVIDAVGYKLGGNIEQTVKEILEYEYAEAA